MITNATLDALNIQDNEDDTEARANALDALNDAENGDDWTVEIDGCEYRFISEDAIDRIHHDEICEFVDDCYLSDKNIPDTIRRYFDYDSFARDCRITDGYGHHFSGYDGSEENADGYYIFRIN